MLKKKYAEGSEAKKNWKKLDRAPKCSILGHQNLGLGGGARAPGAPPGSASAPCHAYPHRFMPPPCITSPHMPPVIHTPCHVPPTCGQNDRQV